MGPAEPLDALLDGAAEPLDAILWGLAEPLEAVLGGSAKPLSVSEEHLADSMRALSDQICCSKYMITYLVGLHTKHSLSPWARYRNPPPPPPAQYVSFQYLLVCTMNYSAFRDYLRWYIAA